MLITYLNSLDNLEYESKITRRMVNDRYLKKAYHLQRTKKLINSQQHEQEGSILDISAGTGRFFGGGKENGWKTVGVAE
jgi:ubiquinone/menaquinone biosynthesis C-methylase UbiE